MSWVSDLYQRNDPKGWCGDPSRGAAMGRPSILDAPKDFDGRIYLRKVRLNQGGYDANGTYFGIGAPLYWYSDEEGEIDSMIRAANREHARDQVLANYPKARVRR